MKNYLLLFAFIVSLCVGVKSSRADELNLEKYKEFLETNKNADYSNIQLLYPHNSFLYYSTNPYSINDAENFEAIKTRFALTEDELDLLRKNNFVVLGKSKYNSFNTAIEDYWNQDIPLYFTSDALLYAFHKNYDEILKNVEKNYLSFSLNCLLQNVLQNLVIPQNATDNVRRTYLDAKLYISVAHALLVGGEYYNDSDPTYVSCFNKLMRQIKDQQPDNINVFPGSEDRPYDFSQLKPRGHYEGTPELERYFKAMMWLGRTELYLTDPKSGIVITEDQLNRQTAVAYLIAQKITGNLNYYTSINTFLNKFIGEQDNVQYQHIIDIAKEINITSLDDIFTGDKFTEFRTALSKKPYVDQKILSQLLFKDCSNTDNIKPASAFMIFGNRFVFDSYVLSNLVYDKVAKRMMPKPMDVLFVLGNNSASEFLQSDFAYSGYGKNIAGLRYQVDSYDKAFWNSSVYNKCLYSIKTMNPPSDISKLPIYMQSPAWWQMKMNTQLASWATIRHNNILYAKQSYTGIPICGFPAVMVEPVPELYASISDLSKDLSSYLNQYDELKKISLSLDEIHTVSNRLKLIAVDELNGKSISDEDQKFISACYTLEPGCAGTKYVDGWYNSITLEGGSDDSKLEHLIADVHTQPADEDGGSVGKVLHVGTGAVNTMIVITPDAEGKAQALAGPVYSYYEYITNDFKRLTDSEWKKMFSSNQQLARPSFTKIYLADENGNKYENPEILSYTLGVDDEHQNAATAEIGVSPNPFVIDATIWIRINNLSVLSNFSVEIFDQNGNLVKTLLNETISGGNFAIKWDGKNQNGDLTSAGVYLAKVNINGNIFTAKIVKQ